MRANAVVTWADGTNATPIYKWNDFMMASWSECRFELRPNSCSFCKGLDRSGKDNHEVSSSEKQNVPRCGPLLQNLQWWWMDWELSGDLYTSIVSGWINGDMLLSIYIVIDKKVLEALYCSNENGWCKAGKKTRTHFECAIHGYNTTTT